jgi:hypothetical protein
MESAVYFDDHEEEYYVFIAESTEELNQKVKDAEEENDDLYYMGTIEQIKEELLPLIEDALDNYKPKPKPEEPKVDYLSKLADPEIWDKDMHQLFLSLTLLNADSLLEDFIYDWKDGNLYGKDQDCLHKLGISSELHLNQFISQIQDSAYLSLENIQYFKPITTQKNFGPTITQQTENQGTIDYSTKENKDA